MKKGLILFGFGLLVLSSCVKERTCNCTSKDSSLTGYSLTETYVYNTTKKTAEASCDLNEESYGTYSKTCELE